MGIVTTIVCQESRKIVSRVELLPEAMALARFLLLDRTDDVWQELGRTVRVKMDTVVHIAESVWIGKDMQIGTPILCNLKTQKGDPSSFWCS